jgi:hypothetical protein
MDDILKRYAPSFTRLLRRSVRELVLVTTVGLSGTLGCGADRGLVAYGPPPIGDAGPDGATDGGARSDAGDAAAPRDAWLDALLDGGDSGMPVMYGPVAYGPAPAPDAGLDARGPDGPPAGAYGPPPVPFSDPAPLDWYGR